MRFEFESQGAQVLVNDPFLDRDHTGGLRWSLVWDEGLTSRSANAGVTYSRVA